jgi:hypothetical protein
MVKYPKRRNMTLSDLTYWIKTHRFVTVSEYSYDSSTNHYETKIYEGSNGGFFQIEFMNGHPFETWDSEKRGFVRNEYPYPREVVKKTRIEEYYESV